MKAEIDALNEQVLFHRSSWSGVELNLSRLLYDIVDTRPIASKIAYAIYYAVEGFHARQSIVDAAMTEWCGENEIPVDIPLSSHWDRTNKRLRQARSLRNVIAHGRVEPVPHKGKAYMRVVTPLYDPELQKRSDKGTIPGLGFDDMKKTVQACGILNDVLAHMSAAVIAGRAKDIDTLRGKSAVLEEHLNLLDALYPDAQKPPKCSAPS